MFTLGTGLQASATVRAYLHYSEDIQAIGINSVYSCKHAKKKKYCMLPFCAESLKQTNAGKDSIRFAEMLFPTQEPGISREGLAQLTEG